MNEHAEFGVAIPGCTLVRKDGRERSSRQQRQRARQGGDFEEGSPASGELGFIPCEIFETATCHVGPLPLFSRVLGKMRGQRIVWRI